MKYTNQITVIEYISFHSKKFNETIQITINIINNKFYINTTGVQDDKSIKQTVISLSEYDKFITTLFKDVVHVHTKRVKEININEKGIILESLYHEVRDNNFNLNLANEIYHDLKSLESKIIDLLIMPNPLKPHDIKQVQINTQQATLWIKNALDYYNLSLSESQSKEN